jgi:hypothetical protein
MIATENKLWSGLKKFEDEFKSLQRVESPITPGASDVEYVTTRRSGWIELKTCHMPRPGKRFSLHCPLSTTQVEWLLTHHNPSQSLHSYVLLAVMGKTTWQEFVVVEPQIAVFLVAGWKGLPHEELRQKFGFWSCLELRQVVNIVHGEYRDVRGWRSK